MKIICVGRNYTEHIIELHNTTPKEILFFLKPETAIPIDKQPFFIPDFSNEIHYESEIVIKISKNGKHISEKYAEQYYHEVSLGIDFTARDVQEILKKNQQPWEKSKAFDGSAPVGKFMSKNEFKNIQNINFKLLVNNQLKQVGNTKNMLFSINQIISYISQYITLKKGDLIFTGTPSGVGKVYKEDILTGFIEEKEIIKVKIK